MVTVLVRLECFDIDDNIVLGLDTYTIPFKAPSLLPLQQPLRDWLKLYILQSRSCTSAYLSLHTRFWICQLLCGTYD